MSHTSMQRTMQKVPVRRAARTPSLRIAVHCVAFSALSQVMFILVRSVFEMRLPIEFLPEVLICFLISYTARWISAKSVIDKVALGGEHKASLAVPCGEPASPKGSSSSKDSWEQVGNNCRLLSDVRAIDRAQTEGVAPKGVSEVMRACVRQRQVDTALKLFDQMVEEGVGHDAHLIGKSIVDKFFNLVAGNLGARRMRKDGVTLLDLVQAHGLTPSWAIQDRLVIAWKSRPPKSVVDYLMRMKSAGHSLSRLVYFSILISSERSDPERALSLLGEMESLGIMPDKVAYNAVLGACCQFGLLDEARRLFAQMTDRGLTPDAKTYRTMIIVNANKYNFKEAVALLDTMRRKCLKPDKQAFHKAIHSCIRLQRIEYAVELYNDMVKAEVIPRERTVDYLRASCQTFGLSFSEV